MFPTERKPFLATVILSWILTFWTIVSLHLAVESGFAGIKSSWSYAALSSSSTATMIKLYPQDQANISCACFEKIMVEHKYEAHKPDWVHVPQKQHTAHRAETVHRWKWFQMDPITMCGPKARIVKYRTGKTALDLLQKKMVTGLC